MLEKGATNSDQKFLKKGGKYLFLQRRDTSKSKSMLPATAVVSSPATRDQLPNFINI